MSEEAKDKLVDPKIIVDFPKYIATSISDQIKQADTKALGTIGIISIITGALLSRLSVIKSNTGEINNIWLVLFVVSVVLILLALKAAVVVVYPRLTKPKKEDLTYFGDIANLTKDEFVTWGKGLGTNEIVHETYKNAYNLAQIADKKYAALRRAMFFTVFAIMWTVSVILYS